MQTNNQRVVITEVVHPEAALTAIESMIIDPSTISITEVFLAVMVRLQQNVRGKADHRRRPDLEAHELDSLQAAQPQAQPENFELIFLKFFSGLKLMCQSGQPSPRTILPSYSDTSIHSMYPVAEPLGLRREVMDRSGRCDESIENVSSFFPVWTCDLEDAE